MWCSQQLPHDEMSFPDLAEKPPPVCPQGENTLILPWKMSLQGYSSCSLHPQQTRPEQTLGTSLNGRKTIGADWRSGTQNHPEVKGRDNHSSSVKREAVVPRLASRGYYVWQDDWKPWKTIVNQCFSTEIKLSVYKERGKKSFILQLLLHGDNSKFTVEGSHGKKWRRWYKRGFRLWLEHFHSGI